MLGRVALVELAPPVLTRALEPFPISVRTVDVLHLEAIDFLHKQGQGQNVALASYDDRMIAAARALRFPIYTL